MTCEKCGDTTSPFASWVLVAPDDEETHDFCSLDCLSRWVEAQQLIAVAEERP